MISVSILCSTKKKAIFFMVLYKLRTNTNIFLTYAQTKYRNYQQRELIWKSTEPESTPSQSTDRGFPFRSRTVADDDDDRDDSRLRARKSVHILASEVSIASNVQNIRWCIGCQRTDFSLSRVCPSSYFSWSFRPSVSYPRNGTLCGVQFRNEWIVFRRIIFKYYF